MIIDQNVQRNLIQAIDFIGQLFGLNRYDGESIDNFYKRCIQVYRFEGDTTLSGLRVAISRELGCPVRSCGVLSLRDPEAYPNAGINVGNGIIEIFEDLTDIEGSSVEKLFTKSPYRESNFNYIKEFKDYIDASPYFKWEIEPLESEYGTPLYNLLESKSFRFYEDRESLIEGMNRLKHDSIIESSLTGSSYLINKVSSPSLIEAKGDYYFSSETRSLITWKDELLKTPRQIGAVSYIRTDRFFELNAVPVSIDELSDNFLNNLSYIEFKAKNNIDIDRLSIDKNLMKFVYKAFEADANHWVLEDWNATPMDINRTYRIGDAITDSIDHYYIPNGTLSSIISRIEE